MFPSQRSGKMSSIRLLIIVKTMEAATSSFSKQTQLDQFNQVIEIYSINSETVFVGESKFDTFRDTLYAIPSYVDANTPTVKKNSMNLLEGPSFRNGEAGSEARDRRSSKRNYILFGYYENPSIDTMFNTIGSKDGDKQLTLRPDNSLWYVREGDGDQSNSDAGKIIIPDGSGNKSMKGDKIVESKGKHGLLKLSTIKFKTWFDNEENKILKLLMVILIGIVITMFWYLRSTVRELKQQSQNGSNSRVPRSTDSNGSYGVESLACGELKLNNNR